MSTEHINQKFQFNDFTRKEYRNLLRLAKASYEFRLFTNFNKDEKFVIWRHDLDFSIQAAVKLAIIEAEEGVASTYFIWPHSEYYNFLDRESAQGIRKILSLGHQIGLHFDAEYYGIADIKELESSLQWEKNLIESFFDHKIDAFSFHNPNSFCLKCDALQYAGMINAYAHYFKNEAGYCSDSNGYWRFKRLFDVLNDAKDDRLQVLTHPEWWVPEPMSPRDRVSRCIDGRAANLHKHYDMLLKKLGRKNIK